MTPENLERARRIRDERAKLKDPIDRLVFDNQWTAGIPNLLWSMAADLEDREQAQGEHQP